MLCLSTIEPSTLELLKKLQQLPELRDTRLVGGTALALQLGHRKSIDLDFFGTINCDTQELVDAIKSVATLTILIRPAEVSHAGTATFTVNASSATPQSERMRILPWITSPGSQQVPRKAKEISLSVP